MGRRIVVLMLVLGMFLIPLASEARERPAPTGGETVTAEVTVSIVGTDIVASTTKTVPLGTSLDINTADLQALVNAKAPATILAAGTVCYQAMPTYTVKSVGGVTVNKAWYNLQWCWNTATYKVTTYSNLWCSGSGGLGWYLMNCNIQPVTGTGLSSFTVAGTWLYHLNYLGTNIYRTITVSAKHNLNGSVYGTWKVN